MSRSWVAPVALLLTAVGAASGSADAQMREPDPAVTYALPIGDSPTRGRDDALVTLVIATEYQCPFCERLQPTIDTLLKDYGRDLRLVHKHFVVHPAAQLASQAACAANKQGKYWEMDELLWSRAWPSWRQSRDESLYQRDGLISLARELGLNIRRFERDMDRCERTVRAEGEQVRRIGTGGVPSSYINGRHLRGAQPIDKFRTLIDEELRKARKRAGKRGRGYYRKWVERRGVKEAPVRQPTAGNQPAPPRPIPPARPRRAGPDPSATYAVRLGSSPSRGPEHAKVTMVIACQFSGPFCNRIRPTIDQLFNKYGNDLKLVMKHFPVHTNRATPAARAACAAHKQGRYWDMDDMLWGPVLTENNWTPTRMRQAAIELGLDMSRYDADVDGACVGEVQSEADEMRKVGTTGTPSTYINGRFLSGARPVGDFEKLIDEELRKANKRIGRRGNVKSYYAKWVIALGLQEVKP